MGDSSFKFHALKTAGGLAPATIWVLTWKHSVYFLLEQVVVNKIISRPMQQQSTDTFCLIIFKPESINQESENTNNVWLT